MQEIGAEFCQAYFADISSELATHKHRRRSSVNFGEQDIFARKYMHEKLTKFPNFTWYMPEKINKMPEFYMIFTR